MVRDEKADPPLGAPIKGWIDEHLARGTLRNAPDDGPRKRRQVSRDNELQRLTAEQAEDAVTRTIPTLKQRCCRNRFSTPSDGVKDCMIAPSVSRRSLMSSWAAGAAGTWRSWRC